MLWQIPAPLAAFVSVAHTLDVLLAAHTAAQAWHEGGWSNDLSASLVAHAWTCIAATLTSHMSTVAHVSIIML